MKAPPLDSDVGGDGTRLLAAVLDCLDAADDMSVGFLLSIDGRGEVLQALQRLAVAQRGGAMCDVETAARDLSVAMGNYPGAATNDTEPTAIAAAVRHIRDRLGELDVAAAAQNPYFPRPHEGRIDSMTASDPGSEQVPTLTSEQRHLMGLLAIFPAPIEPSTAAALADIPVQVAEKLLDGLVDHGTLHRQYVIADPDREHRWHAGEFSAEHQRAFMRGLHHVLRQASTAQQAITPGVSPLGRHLQDPGEKLDPAAALGWMDRNLDDLNALQLTASQLHFRTEVWELAEVITGICERRGRYATWAAMYERGLMAAGLLGDQSATALMHAGLARLYLETDNLDAAEEHARRARHLASAADYRQGEASAVEALGLIALTSRDPISADAFLAEARALHQKLGSRRGVAVITCHEGEAAICKGNPGEARDLISVALDHFTTDSPEPYMRGRCLYLLGLAHLMDGSLPEAEHALDAALSISRSLGSPHEQANVLTALVRVAELQGKGPLALKYRQIARELDTRDTPLYQVPQGGRRWPVITA